MAKAAVAKRQLPVLSQREVADLKGKIEADRAYLSQLEGTPSGGIEAEAHLPAGQVVEVDTSAVKGRMQRNKKALELMDPANQRLTGAERQRSEKRYFELKEILAPKMLTKEQMEYFPSATDSVKQANYEKAVRKASAPDGENSPGFAKLAVEFKRLGRLLWPEDTEKCNLEYIRLSSSESSGRHFRR